jgi:hypothetical protein
VRYSQTTTETSLSDEGEKKKGNWLLRTSRLGSGAVQQRMQPSTFSGVTVQIHTRAYHFAHFIEIFLSFRNENLDGESWWRS